LIEGKFNPIELLENKRKLLLEFGSRLSESQRIKVLNDPHAKRSPRWCGMTIHVTINCPFGCVYCYIEDMGFKFGNPKPYPLSGAELVYALLNNKYFLPGKFGTLIAVGSVSEPFIFPNKALEYLENLAELGNPIQFSTKQYISSSLAEKIANISKEKGAPINPLVTIITLSKANTLEKYAPSPEKRLDSIKNLRDAGLKPVLFLRPVIPGINDREILDVLKAAKDAGAYGVVIGGFRVTMKILNRLKEAGLDVFEIVRRMKIIDNKQRLVPFPEKKRIIEQSRKIGLIPWASTCCANAWNANVPCPSVCFIDGKCTRCPNACHFLRDSPDENLVMEALKRLGIKAKIRNKFVLIDKSEERQIEFLVRTISRRGVKFVKLR